MRNQLRITIAQLNLHVGDLNYNLEKHQVAIKAALDEKADIIVFPELSLTGYPPEDLLLRQSFLNDTEEALAQLINEVKDIYCIVGHPAKVNNQLYNACSILHQGRIVNHYHKKSLPNYGVFDECRYFTAGTTNCIFEIKNIIIGLIICEDIWRVQPIIDAKRSGATLIIVPNASPYEIKKHEQRVALLSKRAKQHQLPIVYVNQIGGQDELIFDGGSMVFNDQGKLNYFAGFFKEKIAVIKLLHIDETIDITDKIDKPIERIYQALVLSVRDYVFKNKFESVIIGISGGIDSALTLAIAVDALGRNRVKAIILPSQYTAKMSIEDGITLADNWGVSYVNMSIEPSCEIISKTLAPVFLNYAKDVTEENIQARVRAILLMALSNKFGHLVLTTGNRSEMAVGYCTLYGDMAGGFAVLKDIPKTLVYELSNYRNQIETLIPTRIIERAPSAELAPNQKDEDTLPPYSILDEILYYYLNENLSEDEIIKKGLDAVVVKRIITMIKKNEYKRRQSAIGPRINHHSFIKDWRYPITNGYKK